MVSCANIRLQTAGPVSQYPDISFHHQRRRKAQQLGPGSWFEFTGRKKHTTACGAGGDCLLFSVAQAAWDLVPADAPKK